MSVSLLSFIANINPWKRRRLETYVLINCLTATMMVVGIISSMIFLIDFVDISKSFTGKADINTLAILGLMILKSPNTILTLLPFAFLFGSLSAFVGLNRRSELIAMRAAGISAWRFVMPAGVMAIVFGFITILILNPIATYMGENYERIHTKIDASSPHRDSSIYLRQGNNYKNNSLKQTVIRATSQDALSSTLYGSTFWQFIIDANGLPQFQSRIDAQKAVLKPDHWDLYNAYESLPGAPARYYNTLNIISSIKHSDAFSKAISVESTPFWKLPTIISQTNASGFSSTRYRLKVHQLLSTPLMFAAMSALGAVFSLQLMRLGGMAKLVLSGAGLGFIIFFINQLLSAMGRADVIPVELAGWAPSIIALLSAMTLLVYKEDG